MQVARWDASAWSFATDKMKKVGLFSSERFFLDLYCLEPGQSQTPHAHTGCDKVYLVTQGRARVRVGAEERTLVAGEAVIAASGEVHGLQNDSSERTVVLTLMAPPPEKSA
jgi:quercetin dioxygenase-like cupin family protein